MSRTKEKRSSKLPYRWLEFEWQGSRYRIGLSRNCWKIERFVLLPLFGPGGCDSGVVDPATWISYSPLACPAPLLETALLTVEESHDRALLVTRSTAWKSLQDQTLTAISEG
ncbi:hypothetical protein S7335_1165 [Synechococcus sp. PCC 7335]|uniref:hypothetical protein n=1 Tax=Synechococcus sp. (strain ATCC 29403 / PCC 7335) TaxID=91464 RepID=UPI00017EB925|nr:hypothetical protein [Synechococcus sp. PCC 7335]EDX82461.1 hypothetical protein S7335_1165 [Synechococcus sp. PCC 7335]